MTKKTFVVFGNFRGGTSMVAKSLHNLGVHMGGNFQRGNYEDTRFQGADGDKHIDLICGSNNSYEYWGWKWPDSIKYLDEFESYLVNPHYILVFRDPYAVASSEHRRTGKSMKSTMRQANMRNESMIRLIERGLNTFPVSFEQAITHKERFARGLVKFVGLGDVGKVLDSIDMSILGGREYGYE